MRIFKEVFRRWHGQEMISGWLLQVRERVLDDSLIISVG